MSWSTMIAELTSTKLGRFFVLGVPILVSVFLLGDTYLNMHSEIPVAYRCVETFENVDYCNFTCTFSTPKDTTGRVLVTHTAWASIYEHRMNLTANNEGTIAIQLPKRTFNYFLRGMFWNSTRYVQGRYGTPRDSYEYGTMGEWLFC